VVEISVDGWRAGVSDWQAVRSVPREQLPPLTPEQREVARKLGISEDDYARSALAGERTQEELLKKTERLARVVDQAAKTSGKPVEVQRVVLRTIDGRFDVDLRVNGNTVPIRIDEDLVDDYFDSGSEDAEQRLKRILERALASTVQ
jgi:hypothetical protein